MLSDLLIPEILDKDLRSLRYAAEKQKVQPPKNSERRLCDSILHICNYVESLKSELQALRRVAEAAEILEWPCLKDRDKPCRSAPFGTHDKNCELGQALQAWKEGSQG